MVHLISECKNRQCQDFYRQNEIRLLDLGCLHYDSVSAERELITIPIAIPTDSVYPVAPRH